MVRHRPLAVFDMDGVLVVPRSSWRVIHHELGTDNEDSYNAYMRGEIDDREFMRRDIKRWLSADPNLDRAKMIEVLSRVERMPYLREAFLELREAGIDIMIISGGLDLLAGELSAETVPCPIMANGVEFDGSGRPTGEGILRVPLRDKGSVLKEYVKRKGHDGPIVVVGDSVVDLTMFHAADLSIAFRPEDATVSGGADITINEMSLRPVSKAVIDFVDQVFNNLLSRF